jgi:hypothetical protein
MTNKTLINPLEPGTLVEAYKSLNLRERNARKLFNHSEGIIVRRLKDWSSKDLVIYTQGMMYEIKEGTSMLLVHVCDISQAIPIMPPELRYRYVLLYESKYYLSQGEQIQNWRPLRINNNKS